MWVWDKGIPGEKHTTQGREARGHMAQPGNRRENISWKSKPESPQQEQHEQRTWAMGSVLVFVF